MAITKTGQEFEKEAVFGAFGGGLTRGMGSLGGFLKKRWKGLLGGGLSAVETVGGGLSEARKLNRSGAGMRVSAKAGRKEFGKLYGQRPVARRALNTMGAGAVGMGAYGLGRRGGRQPQPSVYDRGR